MKNEYYNTEKGKYSRRYFEIKKIKKSMFKGRKNYEANFDEEF